MVELVIRGGMLVRPEGLLGADVAIEGGRIQAIGSELPGGAEEIDARGLHIFPAVIDVHLHFNEPGRTEWEGAATAAVRWPRAVEQCSSICRSTRRPAP